MKGKFVFRTDRHDSMAPAPSSEKECVEYLRGNQVGLISELKANVLENVPSCPMTLADVRVDKTFRLQKLSMKWTERLNEEMRNDLECFEVQLPYALSALRKDNNLSVGKVCIFAL